MACTNYDTHSSTHVLFYSSFLFLIASVVSYSFHDVLSSLFFLALFMTSINHWRYPCYGMNRLLDIACCVLIILYMYLVFLLNYGPFHIIFFEVMFMTIGVVFLLEWILYLAQHPFWIVLHLIIHTYACYFLLVGLYFL
jgi:hypothetical protein